MVHTDIQMEGSEIHHLFCCLWTSFPPPAVTFMTLLSFYPALTWGQHFEDDSLMDHSGMWNTFVSPVRVKFNKRGVTCSHQLRLRSSVGSLHIYLLVISSKLETYAMIFVTRERWCWCRNKRRLLKAVENTCSALWKRKVGDGGGHHWPTWLSVGSVKEKWKVEGCCGRDLCARENSHFLLTSICTLTSNPHTIVSHPPPTPPSPHPQFQARPDQGWMVDVGGSVCLLCSGLCINVEL